MSAYKKSMLFKKIISPIARDVEPPSGRMVCRNRICFDFARSSQPPRMQNSRIDDRIEEREPKFYVRQNDD